MRHRRSVMVKFWDCPHPNIFYFYTEDERLTFPGILDLLLVNGRVRHVTIASYRGAKVNDDHYKLAHKFVLRNRVEKITLYRNGFEIIFKKGDLRPRPENVFLFASRILKELLYGNYIVLSRQYK